MKNISIFLLIIFSQLFLLGCSESKTFSDNSQKAKLSKDSEGMIQIPVDEDNGEVSLIRNFYFIFDGSGSMSEVCSGKDKIDGAKEAVIQFMENFPDSVNIGLTVFDSRGAIERLVLGPVNKDQFITEINSIHAGGGTPLFAAMRHGSDKLVEQYQKQLGYGEYRLIVVTDGVARSMSEAATYVTERGIQLYTIGLCLDSEHELSKHSLKYFNADDYSKLKASLAEAVAEVETFDVDDFVE